MAAQQLQWEPARSWDPPDSLTYGPTPFGRQQLPHLSTVHEAVRISAVEDRRLEPLQDELNATCTVYHEIELRVMQEFSA